MSCIGCLSTEGPSVKFCDHNVCRICVTTSEDNVKCPTCDKTVPSSVFKLLLDTFVAGKCAWYFILSPKFLYFCLLKYLIYFASCFLFILPPTQINYFWLLFKKYNTLKNNSCKTQLFFITLTLTLTPEVQKQWI